MKRAILLAFGAALALAGCDVYHGMRATAPPADDNRARLVVENAGTDSVLVINGETVGRAAAFNSEARAFRLTQGNFLVEVRRASEQQLVQTVFATDGTTQIISVPNPPAAAETAAR